MNKNADLKVLGGLNLNKLASPQEASYGSDSFEDIEDTGKADNDDEDFDLDDLDDANGNNNCDENENNEEENNNFNEEGMNLDDFLKTFSENGLSKAAEAENQAELEDPSMRPLEGFSPPITGNDERASYLSKKLNHNNMMSPDAFTNLSNISPEVKQKAIIDAEEANAARVDELLRKLNINHTVDNIIENSKMQPVEYPVCKDSNSLVANHYKQGKGNEKLKHIPLPLLHKYNAGMQDDSKDENQARCDLSSRDIVLLQAQIKDLKADLKRRDDRLGRLSEHDSLLQSKCDSLTREITYLKQCLNESNNEIKVSLVWFICTLLVILLLFVGTNVPC